MMGCHLEDDDDDSASDRSRLINGSGACLANNMINYWERES